MCQDMCGSAYASKTTRTSATAKFEKKVRANVINSMQVTSHLCLINICTKGFHLHTTSTPCCSAKYGNKYTT